MYQCTKHNAFVVFDTKCCPYCEDENSWKKRLQSLESERKEILYDLDDKEEEVRRLRSELKSMESECERLHRELEACARGQRNGSDGN